MRPEEPISTIGGTIYRDISKTINDTYFEVYCHESYVPVLHYKYVENPNLQPINIPDPMESENWCYARFSTAIIVDMLCGGHEFAFKYSTDVPKVAGFMKVYIDQCSAVDLSANPEAKAFLEKVKYAYSVFDQRSKEQRARGSKKTNKVKSIDQLVKMLACQL